jgi:hypothetical protein
LNRFLAPDLVLILGIWLSCAVPPCHCRLADRGCSFELLLIVAPSPRQP